MSPLPKAVYTLLKAVCQAEGTTQRQAIVAGILGLLRLQTVAPEHLRDVLAEAKKLAPRRPDGPQST